MNYKSFRKGHQERIFILFLGLLLSVTDGMAKVDSVSDKHMRVVMRMIGHEVLMCLGDDESRVMPIEYNDGVYRIPFEVDLSFDPGDVVFLIEDVMSDASVSMGYFVEIEQCKTKEVVYGFEIGNVGISDLVPCQGRMLPKDCYSILITMLNESNVDKRAAVLSFSDWMIAEKRQAISKNGLESKGSNLLQRIIVLLLGGLVVLGGGFYFLKKDKLAENNSDLCLIGAFRFDKNSMVLSFEDRSIQLSHKESELLYLLYYHANAQVERQVLLQEVWGDEGDYIGRTLDVFISKLRKKLEADSSVKIVNIRGVGYKLVV